MPFRILCRTTFAARADARPTVFYRAFMADSKAYGLARVAIVLRHSRNPLFRRGRIFRGGGGAFHGADGVKEHGGDFGIADEAGDVTFQDLANRPERNV